ncbi:MAG TPA: patatin-like phospholipase family protein [Gemmatimonadales bacterium]|nr:patatin-like phospholipase family protein [Gemmatimonadales bacterium]
MSFSLVLSGGGLKGLTHIGVLRALEERGLTPSLVVGVSMGALIGSAWAAGRRIRELEDRALALERSDVFRIAHLDMALRRMLAPAVYRREPLERIIIDLVGDRTFRDLEHRMLVNTVDINSGHQMLWGLPGLDDARVSDAVFASCALPGILPPLEVRGHFCADGAILDNLPVRAAAAVGEGPVVAVDVGAGGVERSGIERSGFAMTYGRGIEIVMGRLAELTLHDWTTPPLVLIRPNVSKVGMFAFNRTAHLLAEGYRATHEALDHLPDGLDSLPPGGIHPVRHVEVRVDQEKCVGCGLCAAMNPRVFAMDEHGKAMVRMREWTTTPLGDVAVRICPTSAISAETVLT